MPEFSIDGDISNVLGGPQAPEGGPSPETKTKITDILNKDEGDVTEDDKKFLESNQKLADDIATELEEQAKLKEQSGAGGEEGGGEAGSSDDELGAIATFGKDEGFVDEKVFKELEDSTDGISAYIKARDEVRDKELISSFLQANSEVAKFYEHTVVNQLPVESYLKTEIQRPAMLDEKILSIGTNATDDDKAAAITQHERIIREGLKGKLSDSVIEATIKAAVESGESYKLAVDTLNDQNKEWDDEVKAVNDRHAANVKAENERREAAENNFKNAVNKGLLLESLQIADADKAAFIDFATKPINAVTKQTKLEQIEDSLTTEEKLFFDYLLFKKAKDGKIDIKSIQPKTTNKKFFTSLKNKNNDRKPRGGGQEDRAVGSIANLPKEITGIKTS